MSPVWMTKTDGAILAKLVPFNVQFCADVAAVWLLPTQERIEETLVHHALFKQTSHLAFSCQGLNQQKTPPHNSFQDRIPAGHHRNSSPCQHTKRLSSEPTKRPHLQTTPPPSHDANETDHHQTAA